MLTTLSGCCGATPLEEVSEQVGRCSECIEIAEFIEVDQEDYL